MYIVYLVNIDVLSEGAEAKEGESSECLASEEVQRVAKNFGVFLRGVSVKYQKELSGVFDKGIGISLRNVTYHVFSTICSNVLRRTFNGVANRWDQTLLVFANYMQLREALQGNSLHQNEMASYIGRYLGEMGFQSWISWIQHQDDWVSMITAHVFVR